MQDMRIILMAFAIFMFASQAVAGSNVDALINLSSTTNSGKLLNVAEGYSCLPRRYCKQIATCEAANWYLKNCPWGKKLDRDRDGKPCEAGPC